MDGTAWVTGVRDFLAGDRHREILEQLVRTRTVNPPGNERDAVDTVLTFYQPAVDHQVVDHGEGRASLVVRLSGQDQSRTVAFVGHIDTVPVPDADQWSQPPFAAEVVDGVLWGRGAADMKGGVTAMILASLYFMESGQLPPVNLVLAFTADEESLGIGVSALREQGVFDDTDEVIICEPSAGQIGIVEKGALWLTLTAVGRAAHASRPDLGINAADALMDLIGGIKHRVADCPGHPLLGGPTCALTQIHAGVKTNILPDRAEATLDIRTLPGTEHAALATHARELAADLQAREPGLVLNVEVVNARPAVSVDPQHPLVHGLQRVMSRMGLSRQLRGLHFYTDASQIVPQLGLPFVILGPGDDGLAHQRDERIALEDVRTMAAVYVYYLLGLAGPGPVGQQPLVEGTPAVPSTNPASAQGPHRG
jgi:succinyl-diaminopimelate desuccinylase